MGKYKECITLYNFCESIISGSATGSEASGIIAETADSDEDAILCTGPSDEGELVLVLDKLVEKAEADSLAFASVLFKFNGNPRRDIRVLAKVQVEFASGHNDKALRWPENKYCHVSRTCRMIIRVAGPGCVT